MKTLGTLILATGLLLATSVQAASTDGLSITHSEPLGQLVVRGDGPLRAQRAEPSSPVSMSFDALGRHFDLSLEPNTSLLPPAARASLEGRISVLRGRIDGVPGSWARIVIADGVPSGMIFDGNELLAIEAPADGIVSGSEPAIYRLADMLVEPGTMSCATGRTTSSAQLVYEDLIGELKTAMQTGPGAVEEIEIGVLGDALFTSGRLDPEQALLTRINNVDGIYSSELGIQITVPAAGLEAFDDASDPFTDTTESDTLVTELASYRADTSSQNQLGLTHLFTGRSLDGSTVGIAYIDALCHPRFGAGLSEGVRGPVTDSLIAAHEIGHNFGAEHDGEAGTSCENEPDDRYIMAPSVNGNMDFSPCSKQVMLEQAARASCIMPLPSTDMSVSSLGQPESILLGNVINLSFALDNRGSLQAENVAVEISLPTNVSLIAASATQGSCNSGAATVSCDVGTIAGSSGISVTLSASTTGVGDAAFTANVTADDDNLTSNNQDTHTVSIDPAVDLAANSPAPVSVDLNGTGTATVTIRNASILEATGLTAAMTLDAGLRADSASWTAGNCTVSANQVDCEADSLGASSSSTLTVGVTGLTQGSQGYTLTLDSSEADADTANNVVSGTVNVRNPSANNNSDGGGGAMGVLLLALPGALGLRRRIRA